MRLFDASADFAQSQHQLAKAKVAINAWNDDMMLIFVSIIVAAAKFL